ncbi:calcium-binding protein [Vibrio lentus]|uniref:calcium-binding protein n=1 Tax=Vibrio lentus TaxID=136468 RepID=UPI0038B40759
MRLSIVKISGTWSGIHRDMLSFTHDGDGNILINILDENDASNNGSITLKGAYINSLNHIELIEFSSDSSGSSNMDASAILAASVNMYGTEGDDYIKGTRLAESIHAGAGDDEIHANDGDDIIHAGAGDDEIHADGGNDEIYAGIGNDTIYTGQGNDIAYGGDGKDTLTSGGGNTSLYGGAGKDNLTGSYQGNNTLNGGEGDDVLQLSSVSSYYKDSDNHLRGGLGDDHITSGYGKDTYYYDLGDGHDVIKDTGFDASEDETKHRQDKLVLGAGIHRDMLSFTHDGDGNILINILDENDASNNGSITLKGAYINSLNHIELIEFSSDSSGSSNMDASAILAASVNMYGTEGDDYIKGTRLAESIHAGAGDDEIHANDGDDIIHAGAGDDEIHANDGDDIIHAGAGDDEIHADGGNDEIYAGIGNDTIYTGQGNDIAYGGDGKDTLTSGGGNTSLYGGAGKDNLTGSYQGNNTLNGGEGDDVLQLSSVSSYYKDSDNHLRGGLGDDHITSGYGKDTYYYDLGDGHDVIKDTGFDASGDETKHRQDKLVLGAGIHRDMLSFTHDGDGNILINILDENDASNNGSITLKGAYINSLNHIELIEFSSDSSGSSNMDASAILAASVNMYGTEGDDYIKGTRLAESIHAGAGDDEIHANDGDDIIHAGAGDDEIHADGGNDEIYAGIGNDTIYTGQGNDIAYGGDGKDTLTSGGGNTSLYGGAGKDNLTGSYQGNNTLNGGEGDDVLQLSSVSSYYKDSDNHLRGGLGDDYITSGYGKDTYYYDLGDGHDVIKDTGFDASEDETKHRQDKWYLEWYSS